MKYHWTIFYKYEIQENWPGVTTWYACKSIAQYKNISNNGND